jgi:hypothetical protein
MQQIQLKTHPMDVHSALTTDEASRLAVIAVTADLEYWAGTASVNGQVALNELLRILDMLRQASTPEPDWSDLN